MTSLNNNKGKIDILLVEDNEIDASLIQSSLKKAKIINRVHLLQDGAFILDFLFRFGRFASEAPLPPETLILLSLNLKEIHGIDVLRKLKSGERSKKFPVIILTSSQEERGVMQGYKLGANACIVKPFEFPKFVEAVAELKLGWLLISPDDFRK